MAKPIPKKSLKQIIQSEYKKCALNPQYFMRKYCLIQHPVKGKVPFNLYPFQDDALQDIVDNRFNIILKSRQLGISTLVAAYSLWRMIFQTDFNILVVAIKQDVAKNLITKVRIMHDNLPNWLKPTSEEHNKLSLKLANGSQIKAVASSPDAGRSEALSLLIIDEAAFVDYADDIWTSAQSTLSTGGSGILLSTPNGIGNFFHKKWVEAEEGNNPFNTIKLKWDVHPERDQSWRDEQDRLLGPKQAAQECDCSFISSGRSVIEPELLQFFRKTFTKDPIEKRGMDSNYWIWEYPDYGTDYMVVADVARGDGTDFSAFHVIDIENVKQVAEYKGKIDTKDYGNFLVSVATEFNNALLVIENANVGWAAIQQVIDRDYPNLFYMSKDLKYVDVHNQVHNKINREERNMVAGFSSTTKTRPLIVSKLEDYFLEQELTVYSTRLIDELFTFIWKNGKAQAMSTYNDDLVMALSIGLWVRDTALRLRQEGIDLTKNTLSSFDKHNHSTVQHSGIYGGSTAGNQNPYKMNVGEQDEEDLSWLL